MTLPVIHAQCEIVVTSE